MARYMKKWWLKHEFINEDGVLLEFNGWINTVHECKSKDDIPSNISGIFWCMRDEEGLHGRFELDDKSICEPDEDSFVFSSGAQVKRFPGSYDEENYRRDILSFEAKTFSKFEARIEDCVDFSGTYVETLSDGFSEIKRFADNDFLYTEEDILVNLKCSYLVDLWEHLSEIRSSLYYIDYHKDQDKTGKKFNFVFNTIFSSFVLEYMKFVVIAFMPLTNKEIKLIYNQTYISSSLIKKYNSLSLDNGFRALNVKSISIDNLNIVTKNVDNEAGISAIKNIYSRIEKYFSENFII